MENVSVGICNYVDFDVHKCTTTINSPLFMLFISDSSATDSEKIDFDALIEGHRLYGLFCFLCSSAFINPLKKCLQDILGTISCSLS